VSTTGNPLRLAAAAVMWIVFTVNLGNVESSTRHSTYLPCTRLTSAADPRPEQDRDDEHRVGDLGERRALAQADERDRERSSEQAPPDLADHVAPAFASAP